MVPKVAGKGSSFKGAALYYLHDKGALTSDRVAFTHTENLPTRDADKAIKCMAWTALHQSEIKARAGGSAKGRKLVHPVYTFSLSWAPDESPAPEEMLAAARECLQTLGLEGHEALFVSHNDEPHPHIHVIVNRVHPETGIAAKLSNDHLKLSAWAEAYEKQQGKIRCEQRVENNERRRRKQFVRDQFSRSAADHHRWRRLRAERSFQRRQDEQKSLSETHRQQLQALFDEKERRIAKAHAKIKAAHRDRWRQLYVQQQLERDKLHIAQRSAWSRLRLFLHTKAREYLHAPPEQRTGLLSGAFAAVTGGPKQFSDLEKKQRLQRTKVSAAIDRQRGDEFKTINADYKAKLAQLAESQRREKDEQARRHTEQSQWQARTIKEQAGQDIYRQERAGRAYGAFRRQAQDVTRPKAKASRDFEKAAGSPPSGPEADALAKKLREKMAALRYREIGDNAQDITKPKTRPAKDFDKVRGEAKAPEKAPDRQHQQQQHRQAEPDPERMARVKKTYRAFRDLADEVSKKRGPGGGRTINRKPPKGPEFR
jgi:hypothetical protein